MTPPFPYAGEASAVLSSLLWAVAGVLFVRIRGEVSPSAMNLGKNLTAVGCFFLLLLFVQGVPWPRGGDALSLWLLALSGVVGLTVCDTLLFRAFRTVGARRAVLLLALTPVLTALGALAPPFSERPPAAAWAGIGVCVVGIVLAVTERSNDPVRRSALRRGIRDGLLAALFQAVGLLLARWGFQAGNLSTAEGSAVRLVAGSAGLVVVGMAIGRLGAWRTQLTGPGVVRQVAVASVLGTFLGIWANQAGLAWARHTGVAATLNSLAPVFLIPLSAVFLGERHDLRAWLSTLLAVGGIAVLTLA